MDNVTGGIRVQVNATRSRHFVIVQDVITQNLIIMRIIDEDAICIPQNGIGLN